MIFPPVTRRIGIVGLDSSHAVSLARLCNDSQNQTGVRATVAWPGGSPDVPLSADRVGEFTREMRDGYNIEILQTPEAVAARCDAVALLSMDGRSRIAQFARIAPLGRPVFINKPLAISQQDAKLIASLAERNFVRWFSASALRFAATRITNAQTVDVECPLWFEPGNAGWFWYGIHGVELIYAVMGPGVKAVRIKILSDREILHLEWKDGRKGRVTGLLSRDAPYAFAVNSLEPVRIDPARASKLLEESILAFFAGAAAPVSTEEMIEIIKCVEAANHSRACGGTKISL